MIGPSFLSRAGAACAALVVMLAPAVPRAASLERYLASAINMGTPGPAGAGQIEIAIDRWSTDAERDRLRTILFEKGSDALLDELQKMPRVGTIRQPTRLGYDLHYARKTDTGDGSARIILATDRPIGFWEAVNRPRTIDYPFTLVEIHMGSNGKGEGKLSLATKILVDKDTKEIVLENFSSQPVMLTDVRRETSEPAR